MKSHPTVSGKMVMIIFCILIAGNLNAQETNNNLKAGFTTPPETAKPRTWWHWTRGNITHEGITRDLEWMKKVGIAGFQLADVNFGTGQTVDDKIMFGTPEWMAAVEHVAKEADRLDLEMALFSSAGWSLAGGPWVKPEQAMKKLVWHETTVSGPRKFSEIIPNPPKVNGLIKDMWRGSQPSTDPEYYADYAVIAFPTPNRGGGNNQPEISVNGKIIDGLALVDDDLNSLLSLPVDENNQKIIIDYHYPEPLTVRAFTIASREGIPQGKFSVSQDNIIHKTLTVLPGPQLYRGGKVRTFSIQEQSAKYFRLEITGPALSPAQVMDQPPLSVLSDSVHLVELKLHTEPRIHRWEEKAGFSFLFDYESVESHNSHATFAIDPEEIIDLTSKMDTFGQLHWEVPKGNWTILRTGYSLTGAKNRPAVPAGLGYEVDKLSKEHTLSYISNYLEPIKDKLGPLFGKRLQYLLLDSWEAGMQNWTDKMGEEFKNRRGYDILPFLPVLTGRVVENPEVSDRFLWDFRRTLADMFAENFYGVMTDYLHEQGLMTYSEASGVSLEILEDALLCKKYVDIPMGEFWTRDLHPGAMYHVDVRGAASAAHAYGKKYVAAEAFTGGSYETPETLKSISDYWFTQGVNRIIFHTSTHQPLDTKPGNAMVGAHIHRNITWADQATPFMTYLARNSYMLQQGKFVADIAYLLKEGAPSTMPFWGAGLQPPPPEGYDYDYINSDILLTRMSVDDGGNIILPDGMQYKILVLPQKPTMTLKTLRQIHHLVRDGATVLGPKPETTPGLAGFTTSGNEFEQITHALWGDLDGINRTKMYVGKGRVYWGEKLADVLKEMAVEKDVAHARGLNSEIHWIHRRINDADMYFISSQSDVAEQIDFSFRISGKQPELWYADDGRVEEATFTIRGNRTTVPLNLEPFGSVFVVFEKSTNENEKSAVTYRAEAISEITGPWDIHFPEGWEAPEKTEFNELISWTEHPNPGIKYFSGTARYFNHFNISKNDQKTGHEIWLDLGEVKDLAEVFVNDSKVAVLWKSPYKVDISPYVKPGRNQLRVDVTNQWTNRLAGDQELPEDKRLLSAFVPRFRSAWQIEKSGLIGPVSIFIRTKEIIERKK